MFLQSKLKRKEKSKSFKRNFQNNFYGTVKLKNNIRKAYLFETFGQTRPPKAPSRFISVSGAEVIANREGDLWVQGEVRIGVLRSNEEESLQSPYFKKAPAKGKEGKPKRKQKVRVVITWKVILRRYGF